MNKTALQAIVSRILQRPIEVTNHTSIIHNGTGRIFRLTLRGEPRDYILKVYEYGQSLSDTRVREFVWRETTTLATISSIDPATFPRPAYFGTQDNAILMEYVPGRLFERILHDQSTSRAEVQALNRAAITTLAAVHGAITQVKDRRHLFGRFLEPTLRRTISGQVSNIIGPGFTAYAAKGHRVKAEWGAALAHLPIERLVQDLVVTGKSGYFLSQGDFKPDNLMVTPEGAICVLDWNYGSKAQPWYDLAYLLLHVTGQDRPPLVQLYLDCMHRAGHLTDVSSEQARSRLTSGAIYQQLARVNANVRYIASRKDPHHVHEFRDGLNGIVQLLSV